MKKLVLSLFALSAAFAAPALAGETTHNGLPVVKPAIESIRTAGHQAEFGMFTQGMADTRSGEIRHADAARGAKSGI